MEEILIAALRASLGSPEALSLLARIEFLLSESVSVCARRKLDELIEEWATEIVDANRGEVDQVKRRLGNLAIRHEPLAAADSVARVRFSRR